MLLCKANRVLALGTKTEKFGLRTKQWEEIITLTLSFLFIPFQISQKLNSCYSSLWHTYLQPQGSQKRTIISDCKNMVYKNGILKEFIPFSLLSLFDDTQFHYQKECVTISMEHPAFRAQSSTKGLNSWSSCHICTLQKQEGVCNQETQS